MISLLIILALVAVPLTLIAKLSLTVLARLLGGVSQSEVATRAEFARIREQLQATAADGQMSPTEQPIPLASVSQSPELPELSLAQSHVAGDAQATAETAGSAGAGDHSPAAQWSECHSCTARVPGTARVCLQCGSRLNS